MASGATDADIPGSGDWLESGLVHPEDNDANSAPYPYDPGRYACEGAPGERQ